MLARCTVRGTGLGTTRLLAAMGLEEEGLYVVVL